MYYFERLWLNSLSIKIQFLSGFADNGLELNAASLPAAFEEIRLLPANYEKLKSSINPNSHLTKSSLCSESWLCMNLHMYSAMCNYLCHKQQMLDLMYV